MGKTYSPEHDRTYRALQTMKNGDKTLHAGDIVEGTKEWDLSSLRACIDQRIIEAVPFDGAPMAPPPPPRVDPWRGGRVVPLDTAPAPPAPPEAEPKKRGRPFKKKEEAPPVSRSEQRRQNVQAGRPMDAGLDKPAAPKVDETGRPLLPGELETEEARQAERLRVARIGVRAAGQADAQGRIDFTHEEPQIFKPKA